LGSSVPGIGAISLVCNTTPDRGASPPGARPGGRRTAFCPFLRRTPPGRTYGGSRRASHRTLKTA
jgi:hypothetical protein